MAFPTAQYGIIDNPLVVSVFSGNNEGESSFTGNEFMLLEGGFFLLLDGTNFLLLGS